MGNGFAQDTSLFKIKELVVIDSNELNLKKYSGLNFRKITLSSTDKILNYNSLSSIPSVNINQYGGIGSLMSVSLRGTSSSHTTISLNKNPLSNSANPFYDLNLLPFELIDEINIVSVGNSTQFGSGSIGGVVDFSINNTNSTFLNSLFSVGSYGYTKLVFIQKNLLPFAKNLTNSISYESYVGNYPIKFNDFGRLVDTFRTNSAYNSLKLNNLFSTNFNSNLSMNSITLFSANYQEQPGAVLVGRLEDSFSNLKQIHLSSINSIEYTKNLTKLTFSAALNIKDFKYIATEFPLGQSNNFTAFDLSNSFNIQHNFKNYGNFQMNFGFEYNQLAGNMLQKDIGSFVNRTLFSISFVNSNNLKNLPLSYNISIRTDKMINYTEIPVSGLFTLNYFPSTKTKLNLSLTKNFRFPSFNEMYFFNYGNINLLPEKSISSEISFDYDYKPFNLQICGFISNIEDKIVSVPKSTLVWTAQNYAKVLNYGSEISAFINLFNNYLSIRYYYLIQTSFDNNSNSKYYKSLIPYVPNEKITLITNLKFNKLNFKIDIQRSSFRYFLPENIYQNYLPSYFIVNSSIKYELSIYKSTNLIISFDINNLTNLYYEVIKNYPMPGRSFYLTIGVKYE